MDDAALKAAIGDSMVAVLATGVVKLYKADKSNWVEATGDGVGQLVWCTDIDGTQFMKVRVSPGHI